MKRRYHWAWMRYPRTTQEIRASLDHETRQYIRGKRRKKRLPTAWDDQWIHYDSSWKARRKTQYHEDKTGYEWREYELDLVYNWYSTGQYWDLCKRIEQHGCWYEYLRWPDFGIRWYGPDLMKY